MNHPDVKQIIARLAALLVLVIAPAGARPAMAQEVAASIHRAGDTWTLSTPSARRTIAFASGKLLLTSFKDLAADRELIPPGAAPEVLLVAPSGEPRKDTARTAGPWELVDARQQPLDQGEQQLDIIVRRGPLQVTKTYVLYPHSSIVREWATFSNAGQKPAHPNDVHGVIAGGGFEPPTSGL